MANAGTLSVTIAAFIEGFEKAMKQAQKNLDDFSKKAKDLGKEVTETGKAMTTLVTGPIVAVGAGILALTTKVANYADELLDLKAQTGLSTDSLQEWRHVAEIAGVAADTVANAVIGLTRRLPALAEEGSVSAEQLAKIGLTFDQLKTMDPEETISTLIDRLAGMSDVMERNSIGAKLFGGAWIEIAPILDEGAEGIAALREEAHSLGLVMSEEGLDAADEFRKEWVKVKEEFGALFRNLGLELLPLMRDTFIPLVKNTIIPALRELGDHVKAAVQWFGDLSPETQKNIVKFVAVAAALGPVLIVVGKLITAVGSLANALKLISTHPILLLISTIAGLATAWATAQNGLDSFGDYWTEFWIDLANSTITIYNKIGDGIAWLVNKAIDGIEWLTGGLVDLGKIDFADVPLFTSLEKTKDIIYGIDEAANGMITRLSMLGRDIASDPISILADNLEHLKYSLESVPQPEAMKRWQEESQKLADLWKKIYPDLADEIDAALGGTKIEQGVTAIQSAAKEIKPAVLAIADAFDLGTESFKLYLEYSQLIQENFRDLPGVEYAETFSGAIADMIYNFSDALAFLHVLPAGTADWGNALSALGTEAGKASTMLEQLKAAGSQDAGTLAILQEMADVYDRIAKSATTSQFDRVTKQVNDQFKAFRDAKIGTIEYADAQDALSSTLSGLVKYQEAGVRGLEGMISKLRAAIGPTNEFKLALNQLSEQARVTAYEALSGVASAISGAVQAFGEGLLEMGETNKQLLEDHNATLDQIAADYNETSTDLSDQRNKDLQELKDNLADGKITQEQYTRDMRQVWADYNTDVAKAEKEREGALADEEQAYKDQKVTLGTLLADMTKSVFKALKQQLLGYAAEHAALAVISALTGNFIKAAAETAAAAKAGLAAGAMAIFEAAVPASFAHGGVVAGALGEPQIIQAHGGERVLTVEQQQTMFDYSRFAEAVSAGVYDAMNEVLPGKERPLYIVTDGKVWARTMLPALQYEEKRLGLVTA